MGSMVRTMRRANEWKQTQRSLRKFRTKYMKRMRNKTEEEKQTRAKEISEKVAAEQKAAESIETGVD